MKILAISGSTRELSTNTALLRFMKSVSPLEFEILVFNQLGYLPVFSPDLEGNRTPESVRKFTEMFSEVDGIIIASPEYVRSIPGGLKNAIDWLVSRFEVVGKPIALVHASHRGDDMLDSLRLVLSTVSENFIEHVFLRISLIGKTIDEIDDYLRAPEQKSKIVEFLFKYKAEIRQLD